MSKATDVRVLKAGLYFLPVETRVPLKFGPETLTYVTCARVHVQVEDRQGRRAEGWGETPLSVQWVWPHHLSYEERHQALKAFCAELVDAWSGFPASGHPIEVGSAFQEEELPRLLKQFNQSRSEPMPWLAARSAARPLTSPCTTPMACCTRSRCTRPIIQRS